MIAHNDSLYIFGGQLEGNFETNEFWRFDITTSAWNKIHDFHQIDDPLETDSPNSALKARWRTKNKTMRATLKLGNSFKKQAASPMAKTTSGFAVKKVLSPKPVVKKKKQWELPPFGEEQKTFEVKKDPESPVSMMMSNSIVLKCFTKKPLKDIYQGPEMRTKGDITGRVPNARDGHAAVCFDNKMVIFGGDRRTVSYEDIHYYIMD